MKTPPEHLGGMVDGAIRNPDNPDHFMVLKPVKHLVRIFHRDTLVAESEKALRVIEIGKTVYDPVLYIPASDILVSFDQSTKTTRCPLKGEAGYYLHKGEEISWSYIRPYDFAHGLSDHFAFWASKLRIEEGE